MKHLIAVLALMASFVAVAQERSIPAPVLDKMAKDLAEMQDAVNETRGVMLASYAGGERAVAVIDRNAKIHANANASSAVLAQPEIGDPLKVTGKIGNWYHVQAILPNNDASGWIAAGAVSPLQGYPAATSEALFRKLTDMASQMRSEYRDNPYVSISGFTVEIGLAPSISVNFDFK